MFLAQLEDILPFMIPLVIFMIPIVAILTNHQRKMAELLHGQRQVVPNPEVDMLRREVMELKQALHEQTIAIDNLSRRSLSASSEDRYSGA